MFKVIKEKIWDLLKEKHVSLAMLYDRQGNILWHKGRKISGNTIADGEGFTKSYIKQAFINGQVVDTAGFLISCADSDKNVPESAVYLKIKSLLINQVNSNFFLYVDSGTKKAFSENDCNTIQTLGRVLGDTINTLENETDNTNGITGSSAEIKEVRQAVMKYALADEPILLLGDTGTGKTHIAQ
ncbi:MAG: sigma-54 factor interaction domain-containing protein, partial [bacterium]|nr:sigma-54 factor interaction domain-containing protein [bacterium]